MGRRPESTRLGFDDDVLVDGEADAEDAGESEEDVLREMAKKTASVQQDVQKAALEAIPGGNPVTRVHTAVLNAMVDLKIHASDLLDTATRWSALEKVRKATGLEFMALTQAFGDLLEALGDPASPAFDHPNLRGMRIVNAGDDIDEKQAHIMAYYPNGGGPKNRRKKTRAADGDGVANGGGGNGGNDAPQKASWGYRPMIGPKKRGRPRKGAVAYREF